MSEKQTGGPLAEGLVDQVNQKPFNKVGPSKWCELDPADWLKESEDDYAYKGFDGSIK